MRYINSAYFQWNYEIWVVEIRGKRCEKLETMYLVSLINKIEETERVRT